MSLRSKRLARKLDPGASAFLDSTQEDALLLLDDVVGSLAHVAVLEDAKILDRSEAERLRGALRDLYQDALAGKVKLDPTHEDVHLNVEVWLTDRLGDLGKKLHTARSRNDQVALDLRLYARRWTLETGSALALLAKSLVRLAEKHHGVILPGYTHLQVAQPVLLSFFLQAHAERFLRDLERFQEAFVRMNVSPLGAAALAGTRHPIKPSVSAKLLGFDRPFANAMDAVSDRDYVVELLHCAALTLAHASSLSEDLILYTNQEFAFVEIGDAFATGSSIMPQKKNPDVFEVTRAKAATLSGALTSALGTLKSLPMAYNRDLQEQKRVFLESYTGVARHLKVLADAVAALSFDKAKMLAAAARGYADATDLADYLVERGVPFRDAHGQAARIVRAAIARKTVLSDLSLKELQAIEPKIGDDVFDYLGPEGSINGKRSPGGTGFTAVQSARADLRGRYFSLEKWWIDAAQRWETTTQALVRPPLKVKTK